MSDFALRVHRWSRSASNSLLNDRMTVRQRSDDYSDKILEADKLLGEAVELLNTSNEAADFSYWHRDDHDT